jgi:hypothetical protein
MFTKQKVKIKIIIQIKKNNLFSCVLLQLQLFQMFCHMMFVHVQTMQAI